MNSKRRDAVIRSRSLVEDAVRTMSSTYNKKESRTLRTLKNEPRCVGA
jgi:hypothetical protein